MASIIARSGYTLQQIPPHRQALSAIVNEAVPWYALPTVLTPEYLIENHINTVALDFDGVLNYHGEIAPTPDITTWLKSLGAHLGPKHLYLLSNNLFPARFDWFQKHLPDVMLIHAKRKKPYPDGLMEIAAQSGSKPENILLADDRLLTGILAACITGVKPLYVYPACIRYGVRDIFFRCLRVAERCLMRFIARQ